MGTLFSRNKMNSTKKHKKRNFTNVTKPHIKRFKLNKSIVSVKFVPYDGQSYNKKIHYSYTYKGVPGGFHL